jgi:hypothetical protein
MKSDGGKCTRIKWQDLNDYSINFVDFRVILGFLVEKRFLEKMELLDMR